MTEFLKQSLVRTALAPEDLVDDQRQSGLDVLSFPESLPAQLIKQEVLQREGGFAVAVDH